MRRFMMTLGSTALVLGSSFIAAGQDQGPPPAQAPKQAPMQAPMQAPAKQAPLQAPTQKIAPVQAPIQAPAKAPMQAPTQSPVQKGAAPAPPAASNETVPQTEALAMARPGFFRRFR